MANLSLTSTFLLPETHRSLFLEYIPIVLGVSVVVLILSCAMGLVGLCDCAYKAVALMATGVVIKLALIPDVEDDIEDDRETVVFRIDDGTADKPSYTVPRIAALFFLPLAVFLTLAYGSVVVTAGWSITTLCPEDFYDTSVKSRCYAYITEPPINCTAWNRANMTNELICVSSSTTFDPFNPLERFVSLLAVQVTLLLFFACVFNKGCCSEPQIRYSLILAFDVLFVVILAGATGGIWFTETDRTETFEKLIIPFLHLLAVSAVESVILAVFVCLLCCPKRVSPPPLQPITTPLTGEAQQPHSLTGVGQQPHGGSGTINSTHAEIDPGQVEDSQSLPIQRSHSQPGPVTDVELHEMTSTTPESPHPEETMSLPNLSPDTSTDSQSSGYETVQGPSP